MLGREMRTKLDAYIDEIPDFIEDPDIKEEVKYVEVKLRKLIISRMQHGQSLTYQKFMQN